MVPFIICMLTAHLSLSSCSKMFAQCQSSVLESLGLQQLAVHCCGSSSTETVKELCGSSPGLTGGNAVQMWLAL